MTMRSIKVDRAAIVREIKKSAMTRQLLQPVAARATRTAQQVARERVSTHTGRYVKSFKSRVDPGHGADGVARIVCENDAPYAGYIERGTRPHVMPAKATVYAWKADSGEMVFTRGPISHPGTHPQRVIEVALKRVASGGGR